MSTIAHTVAARVQDRIDQNEDFNTLNLSTQLVDNPVTTILIVRNGLGITHLMISFETSNASDDVCVTTGRPASRGGNHPMSPIASFPFVDPDTCVNMTTGLVSSTLRTKRG